MKINILSPIFKGKLTQKLNNKVSKSFRYDIIVDKTRESIDSIIILGNGNVDIHFEIIMEDNRVRQYRCLYGSKQMDFILIISGLDSIPTEGHKIEDHLVDGALKLSKISKADMLQDSKDTWNSIDTHLQKEILNYFINNKLISSEVFPQHFMGLQLLEG